jgi:hypothetical protein
MASSNHYLFWTHDTVAAAVLAGVGTASFQSRLDAWATKLNVPVVSALVHGWPMLLIFAGLILLLIHPVAESSFGKSDSAAGKSMEISHESHSQA